MPEHNLSPLDKINATKQLLDRLTDANGRAKCGYICAIDEFLRELQNDVLIMEEKLRDAEKLQENASA